MARRFPVSAVLIVRDEAALLGRCLASIAEVVDEIVVVDTGSTDDTVAIATSYGATVGHFTWVDDFSAARNHALALATHPWRLVLDADEWIVDPAGSRSLLDRVGATVPDFIGLIGMRHARPDGTLDELSAPQELPRLLPREVTYVGRVHEQPTPELRLVDIGLLVGHDGYLPQALARKEGRNTDLLIAAIEADPTNAYLWFQLGSEFYTRRRHDEALGFLVEAYNLLHPEDGTVPPPTRAVPAWWHRLTLRLLITLTALGRHADAAAVAQVEAPRWVDSAEFQYVHGHALRELAGSLDTSQDAYAGHLIAASLERWIRAVEIGDHPDYSGNLSDRATVLAAARVAEDYETMGRGDEARRYRRLATTAATTPA